jgi:hypothetical protein
VLRAMRLGSANRAAQQACRTQRCEATRQEASGSLGGAWAPCHIHGLSVSLQPRALRWSSEVAGARLEGDRSTRIGPASSVKPEKRKGTGLGGYRAPYRVGCVTVSAREGERLTCGVRETLGPAWQ